MKLFDFSYQKHHFELITSVWSGYEKLLIDGKKSVLEDKL